MFKFSAFRQANRFKTPQQLYEGLRKGNRQALAKCLTMSESTTVHHHEKTQEILSLFHGDEGNKPDTIRLGCTGSPGIGKSSFIEKFGLYLCEELGLKVAVLAVDPSSTRTGGSILGDKTRMDELSKNDGAFIRPSPSLGYLGGVTTNAHESIEMCEAAGYDVILIETVGVGQSETQISDLSDMVLLFVNPAGGDSLQGVKRGIMEIADMVIVNKADGDLLPKARKTKTNYMHAMHFMTPVSQAWTPNVHLCTTLPDNQLETDEQREYIPKIWKDILRFRQSMKDSEEWQEKRQGQRREFMWKHVNEEIMIRLLKDPDNARFIEEIQNSVQDGSVSPRVAVDKILSKFCEIHIQQTNNAGSQDEL